MKTLLIFLLSLSVSQVWSRPVEIPIPVNNVYIPAGYDSNDNVMVRVEYTLPSLSHYKSPMINMAIPEEGSLTRELRVTAMHYDNGDNSVPIIVTGYKDFDLNQMPLANSIYSLVVNKENKAYQKKFDVPIGAPGKENSIDDEVYAKVEDLSFIPGTRKLLISVEHVTDCYRFDRFAETISNGKDTLSIRPILKRIPGKECNEVTKREVREFIVPKLLEAPKILLHVRSMGGNAMNIFFNNNTL